MEPYFIGQIMLFAGNYLPRGWYKCDGTELPIAQHQHLFSIIGTIYGGNGTTTFKLPNLTSRTAVHWGQGEGLVNRTIGEDGGSAEYSLSYNQIPEHTHAASGKLVVQNGLEATLDNPQSATFAPGVAQIGTSSHTVNAYGTTSNAQTQGPTVEINLAAYGGNVPVNKMMPSLGVGYIIAYME